MKQAVPTTLDLTDASGNDVATAWVPVPAYAKSVGVYAVAGGWGGTPAVVTIQHSPMSVEAAIGFSSALTFSANGYGERSVGTIERIRAKLTTAGTTGTIDPRAQIVFVFSDADRIA
jgi:hypothetical protein